MQLFHIHKWGPWSETFERDVIFTRGKNAGKAGTSPAQARKCVKCNKTQEEYL